MGRRIFERKRPRIDRTNGRDRNVDKGVVLGKAMLFSPGSGYKVLVLRTELIIPLRWAVTSRWQQDLNPEQAAFFTGRTLGNINPGDL